MCADGIDYFSAFIVENSVKRLKLTFEITSLYLLAYVLILKFKRPLKGQ
jgi:hypothetical protein